MAEGYANSPVATASYSVLIPAAAPSFSPLPGAWAGTQWVTLSDATPNAVIYYTLDGSEPSPSTAIIYRKPISIAATTTIRALAAAPDYSASKVEIGEYVIPATPATAPAFQPAHGKYVGSVAVALSDNTPGATIHYTLDGSTPLSSSPVYSGPIVLSAPATIKAIATAGGYWKSAVTTAFYSVIAETPVPVISPITGYYPAGTKITITDANPRATLRYTTDGTAPSPKSNFYSGPFQLAGPETVHAIAISTGDAASTVSSVTYTPPGTISTIAGNGTAGYTGDGGPATVAQLNTPQCPALDSLGNLYAADFGNNVVRKIALDGVISTFAGNGTAGYSGDFGQAIQAKLNGPACVAVDSEDNVYVTDSNNCAVRKIATDGIITPYAGNGTCSEYYWDLYGDTGDPALLSYLPFPSGVAIDRSQNLYISNPVISGVVKIDADDVLTNSFFFNAAFGGVPLSVATNNSGDAFIADTLSNVVLEVYPNGNIETIAGNGYQNVNLPSPLFGGNNNGYAGGYSGDLGQALNAELNNPAGVLPDPQGNLYIADTYNNRIRRVDPTGTIVTFAGDGNQGYSGDNGPATNASFSLPWGMAIDSAGNLYIADSQNNVIRKVAPATLP